MTACDGTQPGVRPMDCAEGEGIAELFGRNTPSVLHQRKLSVAVFTRRPARFRKHPFSASAAFVLHSGCSSREGADGRCTLACRLRWHRSLRTYGWLFARGARFAACSGHGHFGHLNVEHVGEQPVVEHLASREPAFWPPPPRPRPSPKGLPVAPAPGPPEFRPPPTAPVATTPPLAW